MPEGEEGSSSSLRNPSNSRTSRAAPQSSEDSNQRNNRASGGRWRNRPGRAERERRRRRQPAEPPDPTTSSSHLNPSATEFIPRQPTATSAVFVAHEPVIPDTRLSPRSTSTRGRSSGGRTERPRRQQPNGKGQDIAPDDSGSLADSPNTTSGPRPRRNQNAPSRVQPAVEPKVLKESEDLMLRMTAALNKGDYDCSICTDRVCSFCFQVNCRLNDMNRYGIVKYVGLFFIDHAFKNGRSIH